MSMKSGGVIAVVVLIVMSSGAFTNAIVMAQEKEWLKVWAALFWALVFLVAAIRAEFVSEDKERNTKSETESKA